MRKISRAEKEKIISLACENPTMSSKAIAARVGYQPVTINRILREAGVERIRKHPATLRKELKELVQQHPEYTYAQYANTLGVAQPTIAHIMHDNPGLKAHREILQQSRTETHNRKKRNPKSAIAKMEQAARERGMTYGHYTAEMENPVYVSHCR